MDAPGAEPNDRSQGGTSTGAIIAVPTAVIGYFGQNVPYPGFAKEWGFELSVAMILIIGLGLYIMFKRKDWLQERGVGKQGGDDREPARAVVARADQPYKRPR